MLYIFGLEYFHLTLLNKRFYLEFEKIGLGIDTSLTARICYPSFSLSSKLKCFNPQCSFSDANERPETENGTVYSHDSGFEGENYPALPASPTTIPRNRVGSTSRRDRPRRQRTTSTSQNTIRPNEAIIRFSNNRTIYTAGSYTTH